MSCLGVFWIWSIFQFYFELTEITARRKLKSIVLYRGINVHLDIGLIKPNARKTQSCQDIDILRKRSGRLPSLSLVETDRHVSCSGSHLFAGCTPPFGR